MVKRREIYRLYAALNLFSTFDDSTSIKADQFPNIFSFAVLTLCLNYIFFGLFVGSFLRALFLVFKKHEIVLFSI